MLRPRNWKWWVGVMEVVLQGLALILWHSRTSLILQIAVLPAFTVYLFEAYDRTEPKWNWR